MNNRLIVFLIFLPVLISCVITVGMDFFDIRSTGLGFSICFISVLIAFNIANYFDKKEK